MALSMDIRIPYSFVVDPEMQRTRKNQRTEMVISSRRHGSLVGLQYLLLDSQGSSEFKQELAVLATAGLCSIGRISCSFTGERGRSPATVASSGSQSMVLDERQYALNDGPCLTALRGQEPIFVFDLTASGAWTDYAHDIQSSGVAAIFAVPVSAVSGTAAALKCYAFDTATMNASSRLAVKGITASFSGILRLALRIYSVAAAAAGSNPEMDSRAVAVAAVGLIMMQDRCSRDEAFARLARLALEHRSHIEDEGPGCFGETERTMGRG